MNTPSKDARILAHLRRHGFITPLTAANMYGCLALHSAIARLRRDGHRIDCRLERARGSRSQWGRYTLAGR